jgi:excisionase family DNA binding protein
MLSKPTAVEAAFRQLLSTLDAEIAELRELGSHLFHHDGAPRESQGVLRRAGDRTRLRAEIEKFYRQWQENASAPTAPSPPAAAPDCEPTNPVLIRHIKGISAPDAAKRLGVGEEKVRGWLEAGTLKGYRPTGGRWKITPADLMAFTRDHRDLLRSG